MQNALEVTASQQPLPALEWSEGLSLSAKQHCNDLGPLGGTGSKGSDGSTFKDRMNRYGTPGFLKHESILYEWSNARTALA
jgi:uncharacterized protein YkwD